MDARLAQFVASLEHLPPWVGRIAVVCHSRVIAAIKKNSRLRTGFCGVVMHEVFIESKASGSSSGSGSATGERIATTSPAASGCVEPARGAAAAEKLRAPAGVHEHGSAGSSSSIAAGHRKPEGRPRIGLVGMGSSGTGEQSDGAHIADDGPAAQAAKGPEVIDLT